jgi:hypothetical protein
MAADVIVRSYGGQNQSEAFLLYADDAPNLARDGWVPVTQVWVADEWPMTAWIGATLLVVVGIGIVILFVMALYKPVRTLAVTYRRDESAPSVVEAPAKER